MLIAKGLPGLNNLNDHERQRFLKLMGDEFSFLDSVMLMDRKGQLEAAGPETVKPIGERLPMYSYKTDSE